MAMMVVAMLLVLHGIADRCRGAFLFMLEAGACGKLDTTPRYTQVANRILHEVVRPLERLTPM